MPLLRAGWEDRGRQAYCRPDVGRAGHRRRRGLGQLVELRRQPIDQRVCPEDDDPCGVALGHVANRRRAQSTRVLAGRVEHRCRCVEQEDDATADPTGVRGASPPATHQAAASARRMMSEAIRRPRGSVRGGRQPADEHDRPDRHRQPQPDRVGEVQRQRHACPPAERLRPAAERPARVRTRRAVVEDPLDREQRRARRARAATTTPREPAGPGRRRWPARGPCRDALRITGRDVGLVGAEQVHRGPAEDWFPIAASR